LGGQCNGCGYEKGKPFWAVQMTDGFCPIYYCCVERGGLEHCGMCEEFPCFIFLDLKDPNMTDAEFQTSLTARRRVLKRRAEVGTENWLREVSANGSDKRQ